jgi:hypothetical protein
MRHAECNIINAHKINLIRLQVKNLRFQRQSIAAPEVFQINEAKSAAEQESMEPGTTQAGPGQVQGDHLGPRIGHAHGIHGKRTTSGNENPPLPGCGELTIALRPERLQVQDIGVVPPDRG